MQQVLFKIPGTDIPIYGYGTMLFVAFIICTWLATWMARRAGIEGPPVRLGIFQMPLPAHMQDMAIWVFIFGIIGARLCFMFLASPEQFTWDWTIILQFFRVWDGGLVFYGAAVGGLFGYALAYRFVLRRDGV